MPMNPHYVIGTQIARFKLYKLKKKVYFFFLISYYNKRYWFMALNSVEKKISFGDDFFLQTVIFNLLGQGLGYSGDSAARVTKTLRSWNILYLLLPFVELNNIRYMKHDSR